MGFVDRLILGTNPLVGVSHFSSARARNFERELESSEAIKMIDVALSSGASAINLSPGTRMYGIFNSMRDADYPRNFGIYLMLPDLQRFRQSMMVGGTGEVLKTLLSGMGWSSRLRGATRGAVAFLSSDYTKLVSAYLGVEMDKIKRVLPCGAAVTCVLAHEQLTDLATALSADDLIRAFVKQVSRLALHPGFVTRNFPLLIESLKRCGISPDDVAIMTPFNRLGFQMSPSREMCEDTLAQIEGDNVIAMSVLGGGMISLAEAVKYLQSLGKVKSVAVGVSSKAHARETFEAFSDLLGS